MVVVFDLDDTLYDEVTFVKSGLYEVAGYLQNEKYYHYMLDIFEQEGSGAIFNRLIEEFTLDIPLQKLIEIYRFHKPRITLPSQSLKLLEYAQKFKTALITDGHYIMQQNKFDALDLERFIEYPLFTDFHHTRKPEHKPFEMVMQRYDKESKFIYISDNPKKDFAAPKALGWIGIRYKNPIGIYKEVPNNTDYEVQTREAVIELLRRFENA